MKIPAIIYGTAWKENETAALTKTAVQSGFQAIDTANQKKHYREDFVGEALLELAKAGISRGTLFLQSKFTYKEGQDHRLPYDPKSPFEKQVNDSFASSLRQLHTDYLDSYLLHGPSSRGPLTLSDWEVWRAMESLHEKGSARAIGVSNFTLSQLQELVASAKVKPSFVQNRCYAIQGWDYGVRNFCLQNKIVYQGFSLLTANVHVLQHKGVEELALRKELTVPQLIFLFSKQIGILPITGTTDEAHMKEDLAVPEKGLSEPEINLVLACGQPHGINKI